MESITGAGRTRFRVRLRAVPPSGDHVVVLASQHTRLARRVARVR